MSKAGAPRLAIDDAAGLRVGVIAARWHARVTDALLAGALRALKEADVADPTVVRVPGTFELPVAAAVLAEGGCDAVVALGVVVRGETPHFEYVCQGATVGLTQVSVTTGTPVGFGVLTCDNDEQAYARSGLPGSSEDKGYEAAQAAIATALALRAPSLPRKPSAPRALSSQAGAPGERSLTFEALFERLADRAATRPAGSRTSELLAAGPHAIGKKLVEEAAEVWMAAEHEGAERAAEELAQLIYHSQVMMIACGLTPGDLYARL